MKSCTLGIWPLDLDLYIISLNTVRIRFIIAPFFSESIPNIIFEIFKSGKTIAADVVQILMSLYRDLECSQWTKT